MKMLYIAGNYLKLLFIINSVLFLFSAGIANAEIIETSNIDDIKEIALKSKQDSLIIFDVDQTLIEPQDQVFSYSSRAEFDKLFRELIGRRPSSKEQQLLQSIVMLNAKSKPLEKNTVATFNQIKEYNPNVILLTAAQTGSFGVVANIEDWRINDLSNLGFDLNSAFPNAQNKELDKHINTYTSGTSPVFKNGILFSCSITKGDALDAYLRHINFKPQKVIFIDNRREHVESVSKYCAANDIPHVCIEYTAWENKQTPPVDPKLARLQLEILDKGEVWVDDSEANQILAKLDAA